MGKLKDLITTNIVGPVTKQQGTIITIAKVLEPNESNNTCTITYLNKNGRKIIRNNTEVRLYGSGTDWFPSRGEYVQIEQSSNNCVIIARHIGNYNMDVRSNMELKEDVSSDEHAGINPGGEIF